MAPNTVEAYGRDLRQFLQHLAGRLGTPTIPMLVALKVRDIRAFMAARRADAVSGRSLMRMLAGLRSFARFLEREGHGTVSALGGVRSPKVPRRLPRPCRSPPRWRSPIRGSAPARSASPGCSPGMPPSWPCSMAPACASPRPGPHPPRAPLPGVDQVTVLGKGGKERMVPILPVVAQAVADYVAPVRCRCRRRAPVRRRAAAGRSRRGSSSTRSPAPGAPSACRRAPPPTPCATPSRRISWPVRASCARSGTARPRLAVDHAALHPGRCRPADAAYAARIPAPGADLDCYPYVIDDHF